MGNNASTKPMDVLSLEFLEMSFMSPYFFVQSAQYLQMEYVSLKIKIPQYNIFVLNNMISIITITELPNHLLVLLLADCKCKENRIKTKQRKPIATLQIKCQMSTWLCGGSRRRLLLHRHWSCINEWKWCPSRSNNFFVFYFILTQNGRDNGTKRTAK